MDRNEKIKNITTELHDAIHDQYFGNTTSNTLLVVKSPTSNPTFLLGELGEVDTDNSHIYPVRNIGGKYDGIKAVVEKYIK